MRTYLRSLFTPKAIVQMFKVGMIGVINTIVFFILLNVLRWGMGWSSFWAVTGGFVVATFMSYLLNRRFAFRAGGVMSMREGASFYVINLIAWGVTTIIVQSSERLFGPLGPLELNLVTLVAAVIEIVPKFATYRDLVFRRALRLPSE